MSTFEAPIPPDWPPSQYLSGETDVPGQKTPARPLYIPATTQLFLQLVAQTGLKVSTVEGHIDFSPGDIPVMTMKVLVTDEMLHAALTELEAIEALSAQRLAGLDAIRRPACE